MQHKSKQFPDGEPATERLIVLQLLRNDRSESWRRAEVLRKLRDIDPNAVRGSLARLERLGLSPPRRALQGVRRTAVHR